MAAHRRPPAQPRPLRRSALRCGALLGAALLSLTLAACAAEGDPAPEGSASPTSSAPSSPTDSPPVDSPPDDSAPREQATPQQVPTIEAEATAPAEADDGGPALVGPDGREDDPFSATVITGVWPDESWTIAELEDDACGDRPPQISRWALGEDYFACGDPDDQLIACKQETADTALCVSDPLEKTAVHIQDPAIESFTAPAPEDPLPLMVILADGTTCTPVPRDVLDHHEGRQSWLHCGENSALLLDLATASTYFDPHGPIWTADLGVGGAAPTEVEVREIIYAGTPQDVEAQGFRAG